MEQPLVLLVCLALASFCSGDLPRPDNCNQGICPDYKVLYEEGDVEKRLYNPTDWILTKINGSNILAANSKLKNFCNALEGHNCDKAWPVLINGTVSGTDDKWLFWFVRPITTTKPPNYPDVKLQHRPEFTVYVRRFGGIPSLQSAEENAKQLWADLHESCADFPPYTGAGYNSYFSIQHINEIWISEDSIKCKNTK